MGMGGEEMKTAEELKELVRKAVGETLRKKVPILDEQRLGADLGAESIDRIDLTFRFEEALGKALEDKTLDAVFIATPNFWHTPAALLAMQRLTSRCRRGARRTLGHTCASSRRRLMKRHVF